MIKRLSWQEEDPNLNLNLSKNKDGIKKKKNLITFSKMLENIQWNYFRVDNACHGSG